MARCSGEKICRTKSGRFAPQGSSRRAKRAKRKRGHRAKGRHGRKR